MEVYLTLQPIFVLYKVGEFDTEKGTLTATMPIEQLCAGVDVAGVKDA